MLLKRYKRELNGIRDRILKKVVQFFILVIKTDVHPNNRL